MNSFGHLFRLTTFGESHGPAIGGVVDGMPSGIEVDMDFVRSQMARRRPGQSDLTTARRESDEVEFLSGIFEGRTTGTPIGFIIRNSDQHSSDYEALRELYRPSHADFTYERRYGIRDHRGGGRSSARETASRVVAGALAMLALRANGISISARISQVGDIACPEGDDEAMQRAEDLIREVRQQGDTIGGIITCTIHNVPAGIGNPVFDKLHASLGAAMLSINACHGFDYGAGFPGVGMRGSEQNDEWSVSPGPIHTLTNHSGGIQGGISNGEDIYFRCLFKPVATLLREQNTITTDRQPTTFKAQGRHDPCVLTRAVPIVEAMAAITILDQMLMSEPYKYGDLPF